MIFAAGLGTRLFPITENKPKALVKIKGRTLLELTILKLKEAGFEDIIINVHHFADMIIKFLIEKNKFDINIQVSDERELLLDTGGGLKKASRFFNDNNSFLVHNVDIISDINLEKMYDEHLKSKSLATLAVRNRTSNRYLLFDSNEILCGWKNVKKNQKIITRESKDKLQEFAFSGVQVISPDIFNLMPPDEKFSIIDLYLKAASDHEIKAFHHEDSFWLDVGKKENLAEAEKFVVGQVN